MQKIAISYRRSDSMVIAGRIADRLAASYGVDSIFFDVDSLPLGSHFKEYIQRTWANIELLVVVVGPNWVGLRDGATARIQDESDLVRIEVETAFRRAIPIIPILVEGASMPSPDELPESLRPFSDRNAAKVDGGHDFHLHMSRILQAIDQILGSRSSTRAPVSESSPSSHSPVDAAKIRNVSFHPRSFIPAVTIAVLGLLVAHHLVIIVFDLNAAYLRFLSFVVPFLVGVVCYRQRQLGLGEAATVAVVIAAIGVLAMSLSASLYSGKAVLPTTGFEWQEISEYFFSIALSFLAPYGIGRLAS